METSPVNPSTPVSPGVGPGRKAFASWRDAKVIAFGFAAAIVMLAAVGAATYRGLTQFESRVRSVEQTQQIFIAAQDVLTLLKDGVIAQRGFLITAEVRYLEPYDAALLSREERLLALRHLLATESEEQRVRGKELEALTATVIDSIAKSVELRRLGVDARSQEQVGLIDAGKRSLDRARELVKDIRTTANTEMLDRLHEVEASGSLTRKLLLVTDTIAIGVLLLAFGLLRRQLIERERAEFALQRTNEELEVRISERTRQLENANEELNQRIAALSNAQAEIAELNQVLERRVHDRTAELAQANHGLERFAYSVSHDLRTPLRAIVGFTKTLEREYGGTLDDEGRRLIGVVLHSGRRMDRLIEDLLTFARLGRRSVAAERLDMSLLASEALREIEPGSEVTVAVAMGALPDVLADRALVWEVWSNLLSNAFKFAGHHEAPSIEIGGRREGGSCIYWVRDNGVGFDMKYYDRLFGVFERLHDAEEFPGSGVGLAIVRSAVDKHRGRVWAEAAPGRGATFYFSLPDAKVVESAA